MPEDFSKFINRAARKYKIPKQIFAALIDAESGGNQNARSSAGAIGLGQLMPSTARTLGVDPYDPLQNIEGSARYLSQQYKAFKNWSHALAAYNAGPGAVKKYGGVPPYEETINYVRKILGDPKKNVSLGPILPNTEYNNFQSVPTNPLLSYLLSSPSKRPDFLDTILQAHRQGVDSTRAPQGFSGPPVSLQGYMGSVSSPLITQMSKESEFNIPDPEGAPGPGGHYHAGKDWFAPAGSPVFSPIRGKIVEVSLSRGNSGQVFGGVVKVQSPGGQIFVFRHVDPLNVKVGQNISQGSPIASVSSWKDGSPHSHIEIWKTLEGGYRTENMIDPVSMFRG